MAKRGTLDAFLGIGGPSSKKARMQSSEQASAPTPANVAAGLGHPADADDDKDESTEHSVHPTYPFPIPHLPHPLTALLPTLPSAPARPMTNRPHLNLLYFSPFLPPAPSRHLFRFLRASLPFYRVTYSINRGGVPTTITTPRWTTVFGLDATSVFAGHPPQPVDARTGNPVVAEEQHYAKYAPRPLPACLDALRVAAERATGEKFNFCLVNYYASGSDSISWHSDDERFLGREPAIASFSLGARRDFMMRHKPAKDCPGNKGKGVGADGGEEMDAEKGREPLKLPLASGDMVLMRGTTQSHWLHAVPKRTGRNEVDGGRINITFRRAMVKAGTENYYNYNVGTGPVYKWDEKVGEMRTWQDTDKVS